MGYLHSSMSSIRHRPVLHAQTNSTERFLFESRVPDPESRFYEQVAATILTESTFSIGPAAAAPDAALAPAGCTVPVISTW